MQGIGEALSRVSCDTEVTQYEYWTAFHLTWRGGVTAVGKVDPAQRDADLRRADIVLYEENEEVLGHAHHGEALLQWLRAAR